jgi:hypothetical protein
MQWARLEAIAAQNNSFPQFVSLDQDVVAWWVPGDMLGVSTGLCEATISVRSEYAPPLAALVAGFLSRSGARAGGITILRPAGAATVSRVETIRCTTAPLQRQSFVEIRECLDLRSDPESLLMSFGKHTRRNLRRAERIATDRGLDFAFHSGAVELATTAAAVALGGKNRPVPHSRRRIERYESLLGGKPGQFVSEMRSACGELISLCRGYIDRDFAFLVYQSNDVGSFGDSLSLLHRWNLIGALTRAGCTKLVFIYGCSGLLTHACRRESVEYRVAISRNLGGVLTALVVALARWRTPLGRTFGAMLVEEYAPKLRGLFARPLLGPLGRFGSPLGRFAIASAILFAVANATLYGALRTYSFNGDVSGEFDLLDDNDQSSDLDAS